MKEYSIENITHKIEITSKIFNRYSEIKLIISMSGELSHNFEPVGERCRYLPVGGSHKGDALRTPPITEVLHFKKQTG